MERSRRVAMGPNDKIYLKEVGIPRALECRPAQNVDGGDRVAMAGRQRLWIVAQSLWSASCVE